MQTELSRNADLEALVQGSLSFTMFGSRVTVNPPPDDTDEDWLILVDNIAATLDATLKLGCTPDYTYFPDSDYVFLATRLEKVNLIVVDNRDLYDAYVRASSVCKRLNLTDKLDRIAVYDAVLNRVSPCFAVSNKED